MTNPQPRRPRRLVSAGYPDASPNITKGSTKRPFPQVYASVATVGPGQPGCERGCEAAEYP